MGIKSQAGVGTESFLPKTQQECHCSALMYSVKHMLWVISFPHLFWTLLQRLLPLLLDIFKPKIKADAYNLTLYTVCITSQTFPRTLIYLMYHILPYLPVIQPEALTAEKIYPSSQKTVCKSTLEYLQKQCGHMSTKEKKTQTANN